MNTEITKNQEVKAKVHFTDNALINPTNLVTVNVIGAGGTGSQVLTALARMNHALTKLNHAGLSVRLWDDDVITEANLGRQLFAECELGLSKSVALINRANRFFGTNWKAEAQRFEKYDLVILDELGYVSFDKEGSEILFNLISNRINIGSMIITTNLLFDRWEEIFKDPILTTALVDRLAYKSHLINMSGDSYRIEETMDWLKEKSSPRK